MGNGDISAQSQLLSSPDCPDGLYLPRAASPGTPTHAPTLLLGLRALYSLRLALCLSCVVNWSAFSFKESGWASWTEFGLDLWLLDDCCTGLAQVLWGYACLGDSMDLQSSSSLAFPRGAACTFCSVRA